MGNTTKVVIGGKTYGLPPLNFRALKRAFASVQKITQSKGQLAPTAENSVMAMDAAVDIIAAAMERQFPDMTKEIIEDQLLASELSDLTGSIMELLANSGLVKRVADSGNSKAVESGEASTATSTPSSVSSLPVDVKADPGTE